MQKEAEAAAELQRVQKEREEEARLAKLAEEEEARLAELAEVEVEQEQETAPLEVADVTVEDNQCASCLMKNKDNFELCKACDVPNPKY